MHYVKILQLINRSKKSHKYRMNNKYFPMRISIFIVSL